MRFATAVLLFFYGLFSSRSETDSLQILTRPDLAFTSPWAYNEQTLVNGNWYVRLDPDIVRIPSETRTQIVVGVNLLGEAGTYNFWSKCIVQNWATSGNTGTGTMEFRLGTNGWSNALFSTSWRVTNYVASTAFTNGELRFTQPHPIDDASPLDQYDIRLEGVAITTNLSIGTAYTDAFFDYGLPALVPTNQYVRGNLLYNSSAELGFAPFWMFDRQGPTLSNEFKATFIDQAEWRNEGRTGNSSFRIHNNGARFAVYYSPIVLRPGVRAYTLSGWTKSPSVTFSVSLKNIADTNASIPVTPTNRGYKITIPTSGTNWVRFSTNIWMCDLPTPEWEFYISTGNTTGPLVDDLMLEEGTTLNDWQPMHGVEWVIRPRRMAAYSSTETIDLQLRSFNYGGSSSNLHVQYTGYNVYGSPIFSGEFDGTVAPGLVTNTIRIPQWIPNGFYRIAARSPSHPIEQEAMFSKILYPDNHDGVIQLHGHPTEDAARTNKSLGFGDMRSLSPGNFFRVDDVQPTEGVFNFSLEDWAVESVLRGESRILASMWTNADNPAWWASPTTAMPDTNRLAAYITALLNRYQGRIWAWETRNEPTALGTNNLAIIAALESAIVKAIDPSAKYVALGGMDNFVTAGNVLSLLDSNALSRIDAISCHLYQVGANTVMHMQPDTGDRSRYAGFRDLGATYGKPVWNSEAGQFDSGPMRGRQMGYMTGARYAYPALHNERMLRGGEQSVARQLAAAARSIGHGFEKWFIYDGRFYSYRPGNEVEASAAAWDYYDEIRPFTAAVMTMKHLVDPPTFTASVTNITLTDCYVVAKNGRTFAMLWSQDKTNRLVTLANTNFGVLDTWGNVIQTNQASFVVEKRLKYLVSSILTTNEMVSLLTTTNFSIAADTTPPVVTVDMVPVGSVDGTNAVWFKLTTWDDTQANTPSYRNRLLKRHRTRPSDEWSEWSEDEIVHKTGLRNGAHRFEVQAKDVYDNTNSAQSLYFTITNGIISPVNVSASNVTANSIVVNN